MDFISYIRDQSEKLNSREYVLYLWKKLEGNDNNNEISDNTISEYNNHLPLLLEQFWESALEKLYQTEALYEIDEELKVYLLVLIYKCITKSQEVVSFKCISFASEVYLHLLTTVQSEDFYQRKLYFTILNNLQKAIEATAPQNTIVNLLYKLRQFLRKVTLNSNDLEFTLTTLIQIIFMTTNKAITTFTTTEPTNSISHEALICFKVIFEQETVPKRKAIITTYLFNGLRTHSSLQGTSGRFNLIQVNFRILIKSLLKKFGESDYNIFLNAFIHVWSHPEVTYFNEAVFIMNQLKEKYYQILLNVLNKNLLTKTPHKNLFRLSVAIICHPPEHATINKTKVMNELLFNHILLHCISGKSDISCTAIESLADILMSSYLEKEFIKEPVKNVLNCRGCANLSIPILLRGLESMLSNKWGMKSKNKHLFIIMVSIMSFSDEDHPAVYKEVLETLTAHCSPFDLKPYISLLSQTYLNLINRKYNYSAQQIFKVMFKMALHPMTTSAEFVKYIYSGMLFPPNCKGMSAKNDLFIDPVISEDVSFTEFFQKCRTLGLIKYEHVAKLVRNISTLSKSNMKLLCAIIHLTDFKELETIADYITENFMTICNSPDLNSLLYIYNQIIIFNQPGQTPQNLRCNSSMVSFLKYHLLRQTLRWNCVANAFSLLKSLKEFTNIQQDIILFKEEYDKNLKLVLENKGSFLPILYFSQLVIFWKVLPKEENLKTITNFLQLDPADYIRSPDFNPKIWIGCLMLYTNICVINRNLVDNCLDYLHNALTCSITFIKLAALNLIFDLCNMVTHNFENLIQYMFKQLVYGDTIFKKTCLLKIDRLIRDDYLKLDLEQFIIFVSVLADRNINLSDYAKKIFLENFFVNNATMISRFLVPLIVHTNGYKKHEDYRLSSSGYRLVHLVYGSILDRRKIFEILFTNLPVKNRFTVLYILSVQILEAMLKGKIKIDEGFWKMIKNSIYIFKLMATKGSEDEIGQEFYKKVIAHINKYILRKLEYSEKAAYPEYQKEIIKGTEILLKLLFFNDSDNVQQHIGLQVFDTIIHWTFCLLPDLIYIVHSERNKEIQHLFTKFDQFYSRNYKNLIYFDESFEASSDFSVQTPSSSRSLFNSSAEYIPEFDTS